MKARYIKYIFSVLAVTTLITACYEDKGSYDYHFESLNTVDSVFFSPEAVQKLSGNLIEFTQPLEESETHKRIKVSLKQSIAQNWDNLDFYWILYSANKKNNRQEVVDTVTTKGYLDVNIPIGKDTTFHVLLKIRDRTSDLAHYTDFNVATRPIFKNSLFVLHGELGNAKLGNIEIVGKETRVRTDAYATIYKEAEKNPFEKAYKMMFHSTMTFDDRNNIYESNSFIVFNNDGTTKAFNPFGLKPKFTNYRDYVLPASEQGAFFVQQIGMTGDPSNQSDYYYAIGKDGRFVSARALPSFKYPSTSGENGYQITAATSTENDFVMWDAKNNRFLHVSKDDGYGVWTEQMAYYAQLNSPIKDAHVDFTSLSAAMTPVGKQAIYAYVNYRDNFETAHPFFIFYDSNAEQYFLYELTPLGGGKDDQGKGEDSEDAAAFTIGARKLDNFNPSIKNTVLYNSWFSTKYLFYADGANVIRYDVDNGDRVILYSAPQGYSIACMKIREENKNIYSGDLGLYLSVGMNKDDQGAVAELKLTTASDVDTTYPINFYDMANDGSHFGKIIDIQFVHEYNYQLPNYQQ